MNKLSLIPSLLALSVACANPSSSDDPARRDDTIEVARSARADWQDDHPASYVVKSCGLGFLPHTCQVVAVADDRVVAARFENEDGTWSDASDLTKVDSPIDFAFATVLRGSCDGQRVEYDPEFGFISEYSQACGSEDSGERVTCFEADSTDLDACGVTRPAPACADLVACDVDHPCEAQSDADDVAEPGASVTCYKLDTCGGAYCVSERTACQLTCGVQSCGIEDSYPGQPYCDDED
jgi:hypothetical protein